MTTTRDSSGAPLQAGRNQMELLEFSIQEEREAGKVYQGLYGINVYKVRHVIPWPTVTPVPMQSEFVDGVFHFRGENIPLINLVKYLKLAAEPKGAERMVIISEFNNIQVGFIVHAANNIRRISWKDIRTPPENQRDTIYKGITGIALINQNLVRILDVEEIVAQIGLGTSVYEADKIEAVIGEMRERGLLPPCPDGALKQSTRSTDPEDPGREHADSPGPAIESIAPDEKRQKARSGAGGQMILIIDDSALSRATMTTLFESAGFSVLSLRDGQEAWDRINLFLGEARRQGKKIEELIPLAIVDIEMPRMDGYTLTRKVKEHPELLGMKIILHTSLGGQENLYKGIKVGADEFLVKFHPSSLLEIVRKYLKF